MNPWQRGRGPLAFICMAVVGLCLLSYWLPQPRAAEPYSRSVLMADAHLPVRTEVVQDVADSCELRRLRKKRCKILMLGKM